MSNVNSPTETPEFSGISHRQRALGIVESTALRYLDGLLRQQWNLGQNILLCWSLEGHNIHLLVAPHYFLGNFTASLTDCAPVDRLDALNGNFIRSLIAGARYLPMSEFNGAASRLELTPVRLSMPLALQPHTELIAAIDDLVKRYSITYVRRRAVLLFDIVNFSLATPFEQTSQLNSLSYSLNSAYNKLRQHNIAISFSRTTTGDGYYIWNPNQGARSDLELFQFMLLVLADNAIAQRSDRQGRGVGQIAPRIRAGYHIGSHFEFCQVEGLNPGLNRYIVGDVTIELARMLDMAEEGQVFIGDFDTQIPTSDRDSAYLIAVNTERFVERAARHLNQLIGVKLSGRQICGLHCFLSGLNGASGGRHARRLKITDKHGRSRNAYNLRVNIRLSDQHAPIIVGLQEHPGSWRGEPGRSRAKAPAMAGTGSLPVPRTGATIKARSTLNKAAPLVEDERG